MSVFLEFSDIRVEVDIYHNDFLILKSGNGGMLRRIGNAIFHRDFDFVEEVIVTGVEVCLKLNSQFSISHLSMLEKVDLQAVASSKSYKLPVFFEENADWERVMEHSGKKRAEIIKQLSAGSYSVSMFGFLPGFVYLDGLETDLHIPRKSVPAKYVEAGSIAIGGKYLGLYSIDSPGGWNVIGKSPIKLLEIPQLPPISLLPGDKILLQPIEKQAYDQLLDHPTSLIEYNAGS